MMKIWLFIVHRIKKYAFAFIEWIIVDFPTPIGEKLRSMYWKLRLASLGKRVHFGRDISIVQPDMVSIGNDCWIDDHVTLLAGKLNEKACHVYRGNTVASKPIHEGEIIIGERTKIAPYVYVQGFGGVWLGNELAIANGTRIFSISHHHRDLTGTADPQVVMKFSMKAHLEEQALIVKPVIIEDGAAVGLNCVVLPGAHIGKNSWLGALSLLKSEVPDDTIAGGVPARVIKKRHYVKSDDDFSKKE
jgi:acetyltransferase-like isoleucine patch superfamily enzyme